MRFKTVLSVTAIDQSDRDLKAAERLCEESGSHLAVLVASVAPPPPIEEYAAVSDLWVREREEAARQLRERVDAVNADLGASGVSADVDTVFAERPVISGAVGRRARYSDLLFVGPELIKDRRLAAAVLQGALFEANCPVLIVPEGATPTLRPRRVMVAWSSTLEASSAVRKAVGILAEAEAAHVVLVDPQATAGDNGPEPGADVAAYLARHGAKVTVERLPSGGKDIAEVLRQHAIDISADMIVMGAYGHSRLRQWIFGGVTKQLTEKPPLPLFLAR
ncbi:universal stress protein [Aurantimonas sp. VKM B-3413]|uniref:universal stress protein n=1 Tax=Aurantimonas sp. VKM B-3413 TaxID=2779401 RepID=UPI001E35ADB3|nr:universal stress protein [Aurantimonas sp. VKM B-3413]MCB8839799.1 universal stress protein [Aurantimonas sp. VKM B-3413]